MDRNFIIMTMFIAAMFGWGCGNKVLKDCRKAMYVSKIRNSK